jgi:hypothetical protein
MLYEGILTMHCKCEIAVRLRLDSAKSDLIKASRSVRAHLNSICIISLCGSSVSQEGNLDAPDFFGHFRRKYESNDYSKSETNNP